MLRLIHATSMTGWISRIKNSRQSGSILFALILIPELVLTLFLILGRRMIGGHDGFQYCTLQYYFLNNAVMHGEIPQWIPFLTHGTVAAPWYFIQAGLLQNALFLFAGLLKNVHFLPLFDLGIFIDGLLLLTGTWLLARRFFSSPRTAFFISVSMMGSAIWPAQTWWNFHLLYALPLVLHFLHVFLEKGEWRYFSLAGSLAAAQTPGNLPYYPPLLALVIFHYFLFYFLLNRKEVWADLRRLKFGLPFAASVLLILALFLTAFAVLKSGAEALVYSLVDSGRNPDGTNTLHTFLNYGGHTDLSEWLELFFRISPNLDYTLYLGLFTLSFIVCGVLIPEKKTAHFMLLGAMLFLFITGSFLSVVYYYCWPMMKYYRHLALAAPLIKFPLCFVAGAGFEALLRGRPPQKKFLFFLPALLAAVLLLTAAAGLVFLASNPGLLIQILERMGPQNLLKILPLPDNAGLLSTRLWLAVPLACLAALFFCLLAFLPGGKKMRWFLAFAILALHLADLYEYKFFEIRQMTVPLSDGQYQATRFQTLPYMTKRTLPAREENDRSSLFRGFPAYGARYWAIQAFLFQDTIWSHLRTDTWLNSIDRLTKVYCRDTDAPKAPPFGLLAYFTSRAAVIPPHPAAAKTCGLTEDKIRFFSEAYTLSETDPDSEENWMSSLIADPRYSGDMIFLSTVGKNAPEIRKTQRWSPGNSFALNRRIPSLYQVIQFDSNNLAVAVSLPKDLESAWIFYGDAWHPAWKATVNGKPAPVFKADLAYKAVPLEPGRNIVRLNFHSRILSFLMAVLGISSLFWCLFILRLAARILFTPRLN